MPHPPFSRRPARAARRAARALPRPVAAALLCLLALAGARAQSALLQEDFQAKFPAGWTVRTADSSSDGWRRGTALTLSSTDFPIPDHGTFLATNEDGCRSGGTPTCNKAGDLLLLPVLDFRGQPGVRLLADVFFLGAGYGGAVETAHLLASTDGASWTEVAPLPASGEGLAWRPFTADLSAWAGDSTVHLAFRYDDGGGWPYGLAVDDVQVLPVPERDAAALAVWLDGGGERPLWLAGPHTARVRLRNEGALPLDRLTLHLTLDGDTVAEWTPTGLALAPLDSVDLAFPGTLDVPASPALRELAVRVSRPDGLEDPRSSNDRVSWRFGAVAASQTTDRAVLVEHFTSTNCTPCAAENPGLQAAMNALPLPVLGLSHHLWWPSPTDPFHAAYPEGPLARATRYGIDRLPAARLDGRAMGALPDITPDLLAECAAQPSIWTLEPVLEPDGEGGWTARVTARTLAGHWLRRINLLAVISERFVPGPNPDDPLWANGETAFYDVVRAMLPDPGGVSLDGDTVAGASTTFSWSWSPGELPVDPEQLAFTVFLQEERTGAVLQAARALPAVSGTPSPERAAGLSVWPVPAGGPARVTLELPEAGTWRVDLVDATGRVRALSGERDWPAGRHALAVDAATLAPGPWLAVARSGERVITRRWLVLR